MKVLGEVFLDADCSELKDAVVYVYLENVSRVDAPASRIATVKLTDVHHSPGHEDCLPFELDTGGATGPNSSLILRAHVSAHGGEDVQTGDYLTMVHTSVDSGQPSERVRVPVRRVG